MFTKTREFLDKWEKILNKVIESGDPLSPEEETWLDIESVFDGAKALYDEFPDVATVAEMILVMEKFKKR